jgi:hypothetical protein
MYVGGKCVGRLPEDAGVFARHVSDGHAVEMRDEAGGRLGRFAPDPPAPVPDPLDLSPEEDARRSAEPGFTFEEVKKRLGWE